MNDGQNESDETDTDILADDISDQALEAAAGALMGGQPTTLLVASYCFTC
jgi:hypothetical protein